MGLIQEKDQIEIKKRFADLVNSVKIINFTQSFECQYCRETRLLAEEVTGLNDKITFESYDFIADKAVAETYKIDKIPATLVMGDEDYGIRLYGIPSGYEFSTFLEDIIMVSKRDSGLDAETRQQLAALTEPLHLQVFVTPTCPYCPSAVLLAHRFAMENKLITAEMVEATEFPDLSQRFGVMGVPKTIANGQSAAEGAVPEPYLLQNVLRIAGVS